MSSGNSSNMLDTSLICQQMKLPRPTATPPSDGDENDCGAHTNENNSPHAGSPASNGTSSSLENSPPLELKGSSDKKRVLDISKENYMLKNGTSHYTSLSSVTPPDIVFNVTSQQERRVSPLYCYRSPHPYPIGTLAGESLPKKSLSETSHYISSFLPLIECRDCFHSVCSRYSNRVPCERKFDSHTPQPATLPVDKPIYEWTCTVVTEWMTVVNLSPYMEIFKSKDIKGPELLALNKEKLGCMGIKEEFAQDTILDCIGQLQRKGTSTESLSESELTESHDHTLSDTSFSNFVKCKKCDGYLRGLFHQGQVCEACNIFLHRTCAATGLPACKGRSSTLSRLLQNSKFGLSLCTQFPFENSKAPPFLQVACNNLIMKAQQHQDLDLYGLFKMPPNDVEVAKLRKSCDEDLENINFSTYKAHVIAHLIKRYLVELPDPVIPSGCYDCLMTAARRYQNEEQFVNFIKNTLAQIHEDKPYHYATLQFLMVHLLKLCNIQVARGCLHPPTILIQSLSPILLRPPWEHIIELSRNTEAHMRVLEVMLLKIAWGEYVPSFASAPALPPKSHKTTFSQMSENDYGTPSSPQSGHSLYAGTVHLGMQSKATICPKISADAPQSLREATWYWGSITRETATLLMKETQDGTYLVRDASTGNNEYTLTLRKGMSNKLIKICNRNGKYGFTEPFNFNSVVELIEFYYHQNLMQFNESLDIRLLYSVNRNHYNNESVKMSPEDIKAHLVEVNALYVQKQEEYSKSKEKQMRYEMELEYSNEWLMSFKLYVETYEDHLKLSNQMISEAQPHEEEELKKNRKVLEMRKQLIRSARDEHEKAYIALTNRCHNEERQCRSLKESVLGLLHRLEELKRRGGSIDEESDPAFDAASSADLADKRLWLDQRCTRKEAEKLLRDKKDGTFLVRMAQDGHYALSICCGEVQHCLIYKAEGYGFSEPFLIYKTLEELVLHYSRNSLVMHNDVLQTTLKYPALKRGHGATT